MRSPRFAPAGLLVMPRAGVAFDGGLGAEPDRQIDAWLATDDRGELRREIRRLGAAHGLEPAVATFAVADLSVQPRPVAHTSHPTVGYVIRAGERRVAWAPEFWTFPDWAAGSICSSLMPPAGFARSASREGSADMPRLWPWPVMHASVRSNAWYSLTSDARRSGPSTPARGRRLGSWRGRSLLSTARRQLKQRLQRCRQLGCHAVRLHRRDPGRHGRAGGAAPRTPLPQTDGTG